ncbi:MAG: FecR family protein [Bacteroidales bacterium]|nr:FecR family protein [Bacteroidales bacterium]
MSLKSKHIEINNNLNNTAGKIISGSHIPWERSKEQIWSELEKNLDTTTPDTKKIVLRPWINLAAAAVAGLLIGITSFMYLYSKTITVPAGRHSTINLPDNSMVKLNAQSTLTYKPFWWNFARKVKFEGEAYFEVQKGKYFEVASHQGKTIVLGTSFNIYSRNRSYRVACITGTVKVVENISQKGAVISAGQKAYIDKENFLQVEHNINTSSELSWMENRFNFTSAPLQQVFDEISRQYNIRITIQDKLDKYYTGTFLKQGPVEQTLNLVCKPFNLSYNRISTNEYYISLEREE